MGKQILLVAIYVTTNQVRSDYDSVMAINQAIFFYNVRNPLKERKHYSFLCLHFAIVINYELETHTLI